MLTQPTSTSRSGSARGGETDESVLLAAALVVRATAQGSVVVDLGSVRDTWVIEGEPSSGLTRLLEKSWPDDGWVARCGASPLVGDRRPLRLKGTRLWLSRYW